MEDAAFEALQTAAFHSGTMPDDLTASEQLLYLSLRAIYRDYRAGTITKDQAKREKAEAIRAFKDNAFRERSWDSMLARISRSETVRREAQLRGCELCKQLVRIWDGRD